MTKTKSHKPIVYVAGPYRGQTEAETFDNIMLAREVGREVIRRGGIPIIPHLNSFLMTGDVPVDVFLEIGLVLVDLSDAVVLVEGWVHSKGTLGEVSLARCSGKFIFEDTPEGWDLFYEWIAATPDQIVDVFSKSYDQLINRLVKDLGIKASELGVPNATKTSQSNTRTIVSPV